MVFGFGFNNKTVKELRKNQRLTAKELAQRVRLDTVDILRIDNLKIKEIDEPLKTKITALLKGDHTDKIPWL